MLVVVSVRLEKVSIQCRVAVAVVKLGIRWLIWLGFGSVIPCKSIYPPCLRLWLPIVQSSVLLHKMQNSRQVYPLAFRYSG